ncbi:acyltransferase family protein [Sphingomonas sp. 2R-10]|uniref:acyltransferase family protein n=1 Tax=Sphingomonas sp. 2R-10 TaxID=3045148 RepID=UPI0013DE310B|nr:acyltransferase [Sphingomonas sp. 2R-10]
MPHPPIPPTPPRLRELDGLRGLAALAVALYHYTCFVPFILPGTALPALQLPWGCDGVKLFFAISAFAILVTLERTPGLRDFAWARARRLLPEYWVAMALTGGIAWALGPARLQVDPRSWLANLPLLQPWTGVAMVDGVYWTLNVEILFYSLIALAWRAGLTQRIDRLVAGWMALRLSCWLLPVPAWVQQLLLIEHAPYFAIGLIAARQWSGRALDGEALALVAVVIAVTALTGDGHATLLVMGLAALFAFVVYHRAAWLAHPALLWLGAVSYPFYLLHAVIGYAIIARLQAMGTGAEGAALATLGGTLALAAIVAGAADRWRRPALVPALRLALA